MNTQNDWLKKLMRAGFVANGVIYIIIGFLAVQTAVGNGGQTTGSQGALATIAQQPFGAFLLGLTGIGLVGLMIWYFIRGAYDPDNKGDDAQGIVRRLGYVIAGLGYGLLAYSAFRTLTTNTGGSGNRASDWTATIMEQPFGIFLVGLIGAIILGLGAYQAYKAYATKFREKLKTHEMSSTEETWSMRFGRFGLAARAVVLSIVGIFIIQAAWQANPQEAGGVSQALQELATQPYGPILLGIVALGLAAYGIYSAAVLARYRDLSF